MPWKKVLVWTVIVVAILKFSAPLKGLVGKVPVLGPFVNS